MQPIILEENNTECVAHLMSKEEHWAIQAAIAANRPLLVRGEPGTGKTQLAWAAATMLNRPLVTMTVDSNTESRDLLWSFDAVQRLAEAQVIANLARDDCDREELRDEIAVSKFVRPGPLWWALNWESAQHQMQGGDPPAVMPPHPDDWDHKKHGVVILIDEIDKAESDVPNGLLEALGSRSFRPQGLADAIETNSEVDNPLIVITTNEERVLPPAFLRRCLIISLSLPSESQEDEFVQFLAERGKLHFSEAEKVLIPVNDDEEQPLTLAAAHVVLKDRMQAIENQRTIKPGLAEYLDVIRAVMGLSDQHDPKQVFEEVKSFIVNKASDI